LYINELNLCLKLCSFFFFCFHHRREEVNIQLNIFLDRKKKCSDKKSNLSSMSLFDSGDDDKKTVATTVRKMFPDRNGGQQLKNQSFDVLKNIAYGHTISRSFHQSIQKRHTLILLKGIVLFIR
jgi:hypothetical protein